MQIILPIVFTVVFVLIISYFDFFKIKDIHRKIILGLFFLKLFAGFSVYLVYEYYYQDSREDSDIFKFYDAGVVIYESTENNFVDFVRITTGIQSNLPHLDEVYSNALHWRRDYNYGLFNDNRTIIRFNAILCLISHGNIYVHIVIMSFLSFLGSMALFKTFLKINDANRYMLIGAVFLIPSVLFWTSGLLKEGLMMFSLGFMFYYFYRFSEKRKLRHILLFLLFAALLFLSKIYVLLAIIPSLIFFAIAYKMGIKKQLITFVSVVFSFFILLIIASLLGFDVVKIIVAKQNDFINLVNHLDDVGSKININRLEPNFLSLLVNTPGALINSFFRPFPGDINSAFMLFAFVENLIVIIFMALVFLSFRKFNASRFRFFLFSFLFVFVFFVLIGLTTPNIGALVRYKTPAMPFLLAGMFCITDFNKLKSKILKQIKK